MEEKRASKEEIFITKRVEVVVTSGAWCRIPGLTTSRANNSLMINNQKSRFHLLAFARLRKMFLATVSL